ncbi:MAG: hypothetical protein FJX74_11115, partial [Armatimonadetes bacterium]|nr:hypothetical protein [Armatimonadota bacterium]
MPCPIAVPLAVLLAAAAPADERALTYAELESLDPTTPILRVTMGPVDPAVAGWLFGANVWARYGGGPWEAVYRPAEGGADVSQPGQ